MRLNSITRGRGGDESRTGTAARAEYRAAKSWRLSIQIDRSAESNDEGDLATSRRVERALARNRAFGVSEPEGTQYQSET